MHLEGRTMRVAIVVLFVISLLTGTVQFSSASPLVNTSANTLPQGAFMIDVWTIWKDYTQSYTEDLYTEGDDGWLDLPNGSSLVAASFVPRVYYGVTDFFTLRLAVPIEYRYRDFSDESAQSNTALGDIVIDPKIMIYKGETGYPRVSLLTGVRIGTGDVDGTPTCSDGSTDFVVGGVITHPVGSAMGHAYGTYWFNGENSAGNETKNLWVGGASLEAYVSDQWSLLWEMKGYAGEEPSEYYRLYACPGICYNGERLTWGVSAIISMMQHGGGGVSYVDYRWAPYFKVYYRFF
jgi:hypothetical protein